MLGPMFLDGLIPQGVVVWFKRCSGVSTLPGGRTLLSATSHGGAGSLLSRSQIDWHRSQFEVGVSFARLDDLALDPHAQALGIHADVVGGLGERVDPLARIDVVGDAVKRRLGGRDTVVRRTDGIDKQGNFI